MQPISPIQPSSIHLKSCLYPPITHWMCPLATFDKPNRCSQRQPSHRYHHTAPAIILNTKSLEINIVVVFLGRATLQDAAGRCRMLRATALRGSSGVWTRVTLSSFSPNLSHYLYLTLFHLCPSFPWLPSCLCRYPRGLSALHYLLMNFLWEPSGLVYYSLQKNDLLLPELLSNSLGEAEASRVADERGKAKCKIWRVRSSVLCSPFKSDICLRVCLQGCIHLPPEKISLINCIRSKEEPERNMREHYFVCM